LDVFAALHSIGMDFQPVVLEGVRAHATAFSGTVMLEAWVLLEQMSIHLSAMPWCGGGQGFNPS
jgi:hypothetical protein